MTISTDYPRIDYAARDFLTIREALINFVNTRFSKDITDFTESDLSMAVLELYSWLGDMLSFMVDMSANESFLPTVRQRQNAVNIVKLIAYYPRPPAAASVELLIQTGQAGGFEQDATIGSGQQISVGNLTFELLEDYTLPEGSEDAGPGSDSGLAGPIFVEGLTHTDFFSGTGGSFQTVVLPNFPVIRASEQVRVDGSLWERVEALVFAGNFPKYQIDYDGANVATIRFGDGISGHIPPTGSNNIEIRYRVGGGTRGNLAANLVNTQLTATLADGITLVQLTATNPLSASGGEDEESLDSIKFNAPHYVRTHGNAITKNDYDTLASTFTDPNYGSVAKGVAFPRYGRTNSSANEVDVYVWARTTGGELTQCSLGLKQALLEYLNQRKVIVVDLFIDDGLIRPIDLDVRLYVSQTVRKAVDTLNDAEGQLQSYFNREDLQPGQSFYVSEAYHVLTNVPGVLQVTIGKPGTTAAVSDTIQSSFVVGLTTEVVLVAGGLVVNRYAGGLLKITSGSYAGKYFPIISNTATNVRVDTVLTSLANGDTCELSGQPELAQDVPVAENEIYKLGNLAISAYLRMQDTRETILVASL